MAADTLAHALAEKVLHASEAGSAPDIHFEMKFEHDTELPIRIRKGALQRNLDEWLAALPGSWTCQHVGDDTFTYECVFSPVDVEESLAAAHACLGTTQDVAYDRFLRGQRR